jgi:hypothetical protein
METALATLPYVELVIRAEQAISNGASPAFTMKTFCDAGVNEDIAKSAIMEAVKNIDQHRANLIQHKADEDRTVLKLAALWRGAGALFISFNVLLVKSFDVLLFLGAILILKGLEMLVRWHLHKR